MLALKSIRAARMKGKASKDLPMASFAKLVEVPMYGCWA